MGPARTTREPKTEPIGIGVCFMLHYKCQASDGGKESNTKELHTQDEEHTTTTEEPNRGIARILATTRTTAMGGEHPDGSGYRLVLSTLPCDRDTERDGHIYGQRQLPGHDPVHEPVKAVSIIGQTIRTTAP